MSDLLGKSHLLQAVLGGIAHRMRLQADELASCRVGLVARCMRPQPHSRHSQLRAGASKGCQERESRHI